MAGVTAACADMSRTARLERYGDVASSLALMSDRQLGRLVEDASGLGAGIGGGSSLSQICDVPVFVKRVPLTEVELRPDNVMSTVNVFGLPPFSQYGGGSPGFGTWREVAANTLATNWVLSGKSEAFPLMYHWRVLPGAAPLAEELADVERAVAYWGGSSAVRERIDALAKASASAVLFLEYVPCRLDAWLRDRLSSGDEAISAACAMVEQCLRADIGFMNSNGLLHFDAHFRNILTDGRRLYFADFGLATSPLFALSTAELDFIVRNKSHDVCYALTQLVNWLVVNVCGVTVPGSGGPVARNEYIRRCAAGAAIAGVPAGVAATIARYAPVAVIMNDFYWDVFGGSPATPYPAEEIGRVMRTIPDLADVGGMADHDHLDRLD